MNNKKRPEAAFCLTLRQYCDTIQALNRGSSFKIKSEKKNATADVD